MISLLWVKLLIVVVLFIFFYLIGKLYKGIVIGVLIYLSIPSPEDLITLPMLADWFNLPLGITAILWYGAMWILLALALWLL